VLDNASKLFVSDPIINLEEIPFNNLKRLLQDDNLDIDEKNLVDAVFYWIHKNTTKEIGDHEESLIQLSTELYSQINPLFRMARMEHPQLNEIF